jgi:hypothetical protein
MIQRKFFSINQFANDTLGQLDTLGISEADVLGSFLPPPFFPFNGNLEDWQSLTPEQQAATLNTISNVLLTPVGVDEETVAQLIDCL